MNEKNPVSALIITYNSEKTLGRCLQSLLWIDEIVVVDADSTDRTPTICQDPNAPWHPKMKFMKRKWTGFRDQRNYSLSQASHDWVLVIDSDEECSQELATSLSRLLSTPSGPPHSAYKVRRKEFFLGKEIKYGIWNPSYQDRFFQRKGVQYTNNIHEYPLFKDQPLKIHEALIHSPDFSPEKFLDKMNRYTTIEAQDRVAQGQRTHLGHLLGTGIAHFFKNYFYYGAYKDGIHGVIISLLEGISRTVRHIKIWQYSRHTKQTRTL